MHRRIQKFLLAAVLVATCGLGARTVCAGLAISPAYVEVSLDKGKPTGDFLVTNTGEGEERYRIGSTNFKFSREGGMQRLDKDPNALASWIIFNPKEFTLPPKSKRSIRFVISPHGSPRPGEYVAGMELESLITGTATSTDAEGHAMNLKVVSSILVPIFARFGDIKTKASVKETQIVAIDGQPNVRSLVVNDGNGRVLISGEYELLNKAGLSVDKGALPTTYIFRDSDRFFTVPLKKDLPEEAYTVKVKFTSPQLPGGLTQEGTTEWKKPLPSATAPTTGPATPTTAPAPAPAPTILRP